MNQIEADFVELYLLVAYANLLFPFIKRALIQLLHLVNFLFFFLNIADTF